MNMLDNFFKDDNVKVNSHGKIKEEEQRPVLRTIVNYGLIAAVAINIVGAGFAPKTVNAGELDTKPTTSYEYVLQEKVSDETVYILTKGYTKIDSTGIYQQTGNSEDGYKWKHISDLYENGDYTNIHSVQVVKETVETAKKDLGLDLDLDTRISSSRQVLEKLNTNQDFYKLSKYLKDVDYSKISAKEDFSIEKINNFADNIYEKTGINIRETNDFKTFEKIETENKKDLVEYNIITDSLIVDEISKTELTSLNDSIFDLSSDFKIQKDYYQRIDSFLDKVAHFNNTNTTKGKDAYNNKGLSNAMDNIYMTLSDLNSTGKMVSTDDIGKVSSFDSVIFSSQNTFKPVMKSDDLYKIKNPSVENNDLLASDYATVIVKKNNGMTLSFSGSSISKIYDSNGNVTHVSSKVWDKSQIKPEQDNELRDDLKYSYNG